MQAFPVKSLETGNRKLVTFNYLQIFPTCAKILFTFPSHPHIFANYPTT